MFKLRVMMKPLISIQEARAQKGIISVSGSNITVWETSNYNTFFASNECLKQNVKWKKLINRSTS